MATTAQLRERLELLRDQAEHLGGPTDDKAWLIALANALSLLISSPVNQYRMAASGLAFKAIPAQGDVPVAVGILGHVLEDIEGGLFGSIEDGVAAATFDDLLDHADAYLRDGRKEPAGVLAGVVFEDSARRVYRKVTKLSDKDAELDQIISALQSDKSGVPTITGTEAKRARAAAHVRTKGTHAQWDEFSFDDARATIQFTREFIAKHLA